MCYADETHSRTRNRRPTFVRHADLDDVPSDARLDRDGDLPGPVLAAVRRPRPIPVRVRSGPIAVFWISRCGRDAPSHRIRLCAEGRAWLSPDARPRVQTLQAGQPMCPRRSEPGALLIAIACAALRQGWECLASPGEAARRHQVLCGPTSRRIPVLRIANRESDGFSRCRRAIRGREASGSAAVDRWE